MNDFDLDRFVSAQERVYTQALAEIKAGQKVSCWMWFIFPQVDGLGFSSNAKFFAIKNADEARAYLRHPVLGPRLRECCEALLVHQGKSPAAIFGLIDSIKLRSSMTLFASVVGMESLFGKVLRQFFNGTIDERTVNLLGANG